MTVCHYDSVPLRHGHTGPKQRRPVSSRASETPSVLVAFRSAEGTSVQWRLRCVRQQPSRRQLSFQFSNSAVGRIGAIGPFHSTNKRANDRILVANGPPTNEDASVIE